MIPAERAHLQVAAQTHPGMSGKNNEDRYAVSAFYLHEQRQVPSVLAIVSDGIGGHRAGEVAAEIAVEVISQVVAASDGEHPLDTLENAIIQASQAIVKQSEDMEDQRGMGATCACAWVIGRRLYTATVGDSRVYLLRGDQIYQLSTDHTWIQEAIERGALTPEQAAGHPNAHVIRRYLGSRNPVVPDLRLRMRPGESDEQAQANQGLKLHTDDILFLCSDGLTDLVKDEEILAVMGEMGLEEGLEALTVLANERGGHDNITLIAMQVPQPAVKLVLPLQNLPQRLERPACIGVVGGLAAVLILAIGGIYLWMNRPVLAPVVTTSPAVEAFPTFTPEARFSPSPASILLTSTSSAGAAFTPSPSPSVDILPRATLTPWPTNTPAPTELGTPQP